MQTPDTTVAFENRPDCYAIILSSPGGTHGAYRLIKTIPNADGHIDTSEGLLPLADLACTVQFTETPREYVVTAEYRRGDVMVRRDAHVVLKLSVEAAALAAALA